MAYIADTKHDNILKNEEIILLIKEYKKDGNIEARNKVILANQNMVMKIAHKWAGVKNVRFDDAAQNLFEELPGIIDRFNPDIGSKFSSFLWRSLNGLALNFLNKKHRHDLSLDIEIGDEFSKTYLDSTPCDEDPPDIEVKKRDDISLLKYALSKLKKDERKAIELYYSLNDSDRKMTFESIGKIFGMTKQGARAKIHRALSKIKIIMEKES